MKLIKTALLSLVFGTLAYTAEFSLSTHVLNLTSGYPGQKVKVELFALNGEKWNKAGSGITS